MLLSQAFFISWTQSSKMKRKICIESKETHANNKTQMLSNVQFFIFCWYGYASHFINKTEFPWKKCAMKCPCGNIFDWNEQQFIRKSIINVRSLEHLVYSWVYMFIFCQCLIIMILHKVVEANLFMVSLMVPQPEEHFVNFCRINCSLWLALSLLGYRQDLYSIIQCRSYKKCYFCTFMIIMILVAYKK